eukprot:1482469-Rhodomonas_salina.2
MCIRDSLCPPPLQCWPGGAVPRQGAMSDGDGAWGQTWDVLVKSVFGVIMLRNLPDIGTLLESAAQELESVGLTAKAAHHAGVSYDDDDVKAARPTL